MHRLLIEINKVNDIENFSRILECGCYFKCMVNTNIIDILCKQIEIPFSYLESRIQSLFLNGKVVDDLRNTIISCGDKIALSAAMPGLVGAIFRRGGDLASLRSSISSLKMTPSSKNVSKMIMVKFFNHISKELAEKILFSNKVISDIEILAKILHYISTENPNTIRRLIFNDKLIDKLRQSTKEKVHGLVSVTFRIS